jgi:hypothetical protein
MSGRTTLDTNILRVRNVFAINPSTQNYIQPFQIPLVYEEGRIKFYSTMEYLSTISIPVATGGPNWSANGSNTLSNILTSIQPGLSTFALITQSNFLSTVDHLANTGVGGILTGQGYYVSTQTLNTRIARLSQDHQYISTTALWFALENLGNLQRILTAGPFNLITPPLSVQPPGATIGYISTVHAGEYKMYYSSLNIAGANLDSAGWVNGEVKATTDIYTTGYTGKIVESSIMLLNVNLNLELTASATAATNAYVSSFIVDVANPSVPLGTPIVSKLTTNQTVLKCGSLNFALASNELPTPFVNKNLQLRHVLLTDPADPRTFTATTWIPETGGIFLTLNNQTS